MSECNDKEILILTPFFKNTIVKYILFPAKFKRYLCKFCFFWEVDTERERIGGTSNIEEYHQKRNK